MTEMYANLFYVGILYTKPNVLDLDKLSKKLGGRIKGDKLALDDLEISRNGRIKARAPDQTVASTKLSKLVKEIQALTKVRIVGVGSYSSKGKLQVFFPFLSDAVDLLENEAKNILIELGSSKNSAEAQAHTIANEILCAMIRKDKVVNQSLANIGLYDYAENSGFIIFDENLRNSMIDSYVKLIQEKKITLDDKTPLIQRLIKAVKQKKDEVIYGIVGAVIVESVVRLIIILMESKHCERGECEIPKSLARLIERDIVTAGELASMMNTTEPHGLMVLNALELLGIVQIEDESLRAFRKTGRTSIPNVVGMTFFHKGEKAVASSVFHQTLHMDFKSSAKDEWLPDREIAIQIYKTFLQKEN